MRSAETRLWAIKLPYLQAPITLYVEAGFRGLRQDDPQFRRTVAPILLRHMPETGRGVPGALLLHRGAP